ncbi:MAG: phage tail tip lysozyme [Acetobacter papayae]
MAATVSVILSATDRASKTFDAFNNRLVSIQSPVRNLQRSIARFSDVTGMTRLRKGMGDLSRSTLGAFRSVGRLVPEMGALTGAASLAGVYKLASAWAQVGSNLRTSARSMGMAPGRLMALQNAARLSGGSADAMSSALGQLATQKWEAANGFAPEAAAQFQALGISMEELKKLSPEQLFDRIANKIRGIKDPAAQSIAALKLFGQAGEGLLPIFQQTSAEYQQNIKLAQRYGVMNQSGADAAARMQKAQQQLTLAVEGFGYSIAEAVEPAITPVIQQMAEWIATNRQWIAQDIAGYVRQFANWLKNGGWEKVKQDIAGVTLAISAVVDKLGAWKSVAIAAMGAMTILYGAPIIAGFIGLAGVIGPVGAALTAATAAATALFAVLSPEKFRNFMDGLPGISMLENTVSNLTGGAFGRSYKEQHVAQVAQNLGGEQAVEQGRNIQQFFMRNGYTGAQAAGLVANLAQEDSNFDPAKEGDNGTAYGIGQWHKDRQEDFRRVIGRDIRGSSRDEQLRFMKWELDNRSYLGGNEIRHAQSASQAAALASANYFRPGLTRADQLREMSSRAGMGEDWYRTLSAPAAQMPAQSSGAAAPGSDRMQLDVHVKTEGPAGSSVRTESKSSNLKVAGVTQRRAMDPGNTAIGN